MFAPATLLAPLGPGHAARSKRVGVLGSMVLDRRWSRSGLISGLPVWTVYRDHGGVARNVTENLARLGAEPGFIGLGEPGPEGAAFERRLAGVGAAVLTTPVARGIGRFDYEVSDGGDPVWTGIHLPAVEALSWPVVAAATDWLRGARAVLVETGLPLPTLARLREWTGRRGIPVWGLPTSIAAVGPRWDLLRSLALVVLNEFEAAELLSGGSGDSMTDALALTARGLPAVVVTTGARGAVCAAADGSCSVHPARQVSSVDATGAGDAFVAGLAVALAHGEPWTAAVDHAMAVAAVTVGCSRSTCTRLGEDPK